MFNIQELQTIKTYKMPVVLLYLLITGMFQSEIIKIF